MYDWLDYLVATVSSVAIVTPTIVGLWMIFTAMFPQRRTRPLSGTKRRHQNVGDPLDLNAISTHRVTSVAAGRVNYLRGLADAQKEEAQ